MENLKLVNMNMFGKNIYIYIGDKYPQHCMSSSIHIDSMLNYFPLKILTCVDDLSDLHNKRYNNEVEYLHVVVFIDDDGCVHDSSWDRYQEIFDQCSKLKQIAFHFEDEEGEEISFDDLKVIWIGWNEKVEYFKNRGIQIVKHHAIVENQDLQLKVAKEAGLKWRFNFY